MKSIFKLTFILITTAALAQSGNLDNTFGVNGKVTTGFGRSEAYANSMAVQPDGKIICAGMSYTANTNLESEGDSYNALMVRYNSDGSLDSSFGTNGIVKSQIRSSSGGTRIYTAIYFIKLLNDGKILTYGFRGLNALYGGSLILGRYNPDGSLDTGFGNNGYVETNGSPIRGNNSIQIQPDGKLVVLSAEYNSVTNSALFIIERFDENGTIDTNFATNGRTTTTFGFLQNHPNSLALQPDGKILAIGSGNAKTLIARYTTTGILDNTFDGDGKVITSFGIGTNGSYMTVLPDGKILTVGMAHTATTNNFSLVRYNANGSIDNTFDGDGRILTPFDSNDNSYFINAVAQQSDGKFLVSTQTVAADYSGNVESFVIRRFNNDGAVDNTFGMNGKVITAIQNGSHVGKCVSFQADNKILLAGYSNYLSQDPAVVDFNLLRFNSDGNLDTSFNDDGIVSTKIESSNDNGSILLKQPDDKLILVGVKRNSTISTGGSSDIIMSRYNPDGSLDHTFGIMGKSISIFGQNVNKVTKAVLQNDGKILVTNEYYSFPSTTGNEIIRFNANGSIDSTFGNTGKISIPFPAIALHAAQNNKFFIISYHINPIDNSEGLVLTCFNDNGIIDNSFGINGTAYIDVNTYAPPQIISQTDGKIIVSFSPSNTNGASGFSLIRFNTDGTLDSGFENGILVSDFASTSNAVFIESDGKIIVAGKSLATNGDTYSYYQFVTARYLTNGNLDSTYGTDGVTKTFLGDLYTSYNIIKSIVLQPDGKFLLAMSKEDQNPSNPTPQSYDFVLYRFNKQGEYDSDFGIDGKVATAFFNKYDEAFSIVLQSDNKIVVAGTTDNGITRDFALARYENSIDDLGINTVNLNSRPSIYPNPVSNILNIGFITGDHTIINSLSIYNTLGQVEFKESNGFTKIDVSHFQQGIYFINMETNKGRLSGTFLKI